MTDVAEKLDLSHAILYRYVEGKEALLELSIRYAMDPSAELAVDLPLPTPRQGYILELMRDWLVVHAAFPKLRSALGTDASGDAAAELTGIIDELYDFTEQHRMLLLLIESLIDDFPGLNAESVNQRKQNQSKRLTAYLASRAASGGLRPLADPEVAAHFLMETIAWFAQHRKRDPNAALIDDETAHSSMRSLLYAAFVSDAAETHQ